MFGVAEDIDLTGLVGHSVERLSVGVGRLELALDDDWKINIECAWTLEGDAGPIAAGQRANLLDSAEQLKRLVGATVGLAVPQPPDRVEIDFGEYGRLVLIDDSDMLESFSIEPIGVIV